MWRIETYTDGAGAPYDRRAAVFDRLVRSETYNRLAWSSSPARYEAFAVAAAREGSGPLLEVAAGSAAATAAIHGAAKRPTVLVDLSAAMLGRAGARIAAAAGGELPERVRLAQADVLSLPFPPAGFETVLGLGLTHLFADVAALVDALRRQLAPGGRLHLAGLVAETRRGRRYLGALHRAGEVAAPRRAEELHAALGRPTEFTVDGCMAFATIVA